MRGIDRHKEMGGSIGSNDEPFTHPLLSKHRTFSAYDSPSPLSESRKRIQPIQIYRLLETYSPRCSS